MESPVSKNVPFNTIKVDEKLNSRKKLKNIGELADSIKADGLKSALPVTNGGDEKHPYTLAAGYRRHAALVSLKWGSKDVPIIIVKDNAITNLVENIQRDDLHPVDAARRLGQMVRGDYPVAEGETARPWEKKELAAKIGKSSQHLANLLRVDENVASEVKKKLENKDVSARFMFALAGMKEEEQVVAADAWIVETEAMEKAGKKKKPRKAKGGGGDSDGGGGGMEGFISPKKVISTFAGVNYTLPDYVAMFTAKKDQVKGKEEQAEIQGAINALQFVLGAKGFKKMPGVVAADFELIAEEEEEEEEEEEAAAEE
jgi:ParB/RepB/Spo0J family partition protein